MHELAICQSLLRQVERAALSQAATEVTEIVLAIGPLSGVEVPLLERAFTVARSGTVASRAALRIETRPVIVRCRACALETPAAVNALLCGQCGGWQVELKSGDELLLMRVELAGSAGRAAANQ